MKIPGLLMDWKLLIIGLYLLMALGTFHRNLDWRSPEVLWTKAVEVSPLHARPRLNLAEFMMQRQDFDGASFQYQMVLKTSQIDRTSLYQSNVRAGALINLSVIDMVQGRYDLAKRYMDLLLVEWPQLDFVRFNRGVAKLTLGDCRGARTDFMQVNWVSGPLPQC